jgi:staphylococcal nuclease domain-containing protein 1
VACAVMHPAGNVAEFLVSAGLARVVDWHAGMLSSIPGAMERLRAAEKQAKEKRLGLYATSGGPGATGAGGKADGGPSKPSVSGSRTWEGVVVRVWTGDQVSIVDSAGRERRVQLSSVRGPKWVSISLLSGKGQESGRLIMPMNRMSDPKQAYYAHEAREFLRKKLIGKHVKVYVDYIKPKDGEFEERECVTVRYGGGNSNVAEQLIEKGLASVIRHKRDDEDRSSDFDKLMVAEQT